MLCDAPPNVMTPELTEQLRKHKDQIIAFLNKEAVAATADNEFCHSRYLAQHGSTAVVCAGELVVPGSA